MASERGEMALGVREHSDVHVHGHRTSLVIVGKGWLGRKGRYSSRLRSEEKADLLHNLIVGTVCCSAGSRVSKHCLPNSPERP